MIQRFLSRRVGLLANGEPDGPASCGGFRARSGGNRCASGRATRPISLQLLGQQQRADVADVVLDEPVASRGLRGGQCRPVGASSGGRQAPGGHATAPSRFDAWIEAHFNQFSGDNNGPRNRGRFNIVYVGSDYLVTDAVLVGVLAQFDWMSESSAVLQNSVNGSGAMIGPISAPS